MGSVCIGASMFQSPRNAHFRPRPGSLGFGTSCNRFGTSIAHGVRSRAAWSPQLNQIFLPTTVFVCLVFSLSCGGVGSTGPRGPQGETGPEGPSGVSAVYQFNTMQRTVLIPLPANKQLTETVVASGSINVVQRSYFWATASV